MVGLKRKSTMDPLKADVPPVKDMTIDNITANTIQINSQGHDPRLTYVLEILVSHLHDFTRETRLSTKEWMTALEFLTAVGQTCTDVRQVGTCCTQMEDCLGLWISGIHSAL